MKNYLPVLEKSTLFSGVGTEDLMTMLQCLSPRMERYAKEEHILRRGESVDRVGLLLQGKAFVTEEDFWGNRNIVTYLAPGELFAEAFACLPRGEMAVSVVAEEECTVLFLDVQRIVTTCASSCAFHNRMLRNFLAALAEKNLRFQEKLSHMARRSTREKLLSYLSAQALRQGSGDFTIPFDRQQLADYLSVDRSAMSEQLSRLRREGVLDYERKCFSLKKSPADPR